METQSLSTGSQWPLALRAFTVKGQMHCKLINIAGCEWEIKGRDNLLQVKV